MPKSFDEMVADQQLFTPPMRRAYRESAGLSLEQVAREMGVTRMTVWRWENGKRSPRGENRVRYSRFLRTLKEAVDHV